LIIFCNFLSLKRGLKEEEEEVRGGEDKGVCDDRGLIDDDGV